MARNTEFVILGMLVISPKSGYDIRQEIKRDLGAFWSESDGQLYPALKRLVEAEEIKLLNIAQENSRAKKTYEITDLGRLRLRKWLEQPIATDIIRNEFCLKMFFAASADPEVVKDMVLAQRRSLRHALTWVKHGYSDIEAIEDDSPSSLHKPFWFATAKYGDYLINAKLKWCDEMIEELDAMISSQS